MLRARYDKIMATVHNSKLEESEAIEETPKEHSSGLSNIESFSGLYPLDRNFLLVLVPIRDLKTFPPPPSHRVRSCPSRFLFCACRFEPFSFPPKLKCVRTFLLILRLNEAPFNPFRNFLELCTSQAGLCAVTNRRLTWRRDARDNNEISSVLLKCSSKQKECSSRSSVDAGKFLFKFLSLSLLLIHNLYFSIFAHILYSWYPNLEASSSDQRWVGSGIRQEFTPNLRKVLQVWRRSCSGVSNEILFLI